MIASGPERVHARCLRPIVLAPTERGPANLLMQARGSSAPVSAPSGDLLLQIQKHPGTFARLRVVSFVFREK